MLGTVPTLNLNLLSTGKEKMAEVENALSTVGSTMRKSFSSGSSSCSSGGDDGFPKNCSVNINRFLKLTGLILRSKSYIELELQACVLLLNPIYLSYYSTVVLTR